MNWLLIAAPKSRDHAQGISRHHLDARPVLHRRDENRTARLRRMIELSAAVRAGTKEIGTSQRCSWAPQSGFINRSDFLMKAG
jgi:hypothetical protein